MRPHSWRGAVNLVLTVTVDPAQEGGALVTAKQAGIPWLGLGTYESPNPNVLSYYGDVRAEGQVYNDWLFNRMLAKVGSGATAQLASYDATSVGAGSRIAKASRLATLKTYPRIKEVVDHDLDIANIVQDTLDTTGQTIGQYPELTAFWTVCDLCVPLIAQELDTKGITGAARPLVSGEFSTPQTVVDIRKGTVTGVIGRAVGGERVGCRRPGARALGPRQGDSGQRHQGLRQRVRAEVHAAVHPLQGEHLDRPRAVLRLGLPRLLQVEVARRVRHQGLSGSDAAPGARPRSRGERTTTRRDPQEGAERAAACILGRPSLPEDARPWLSAISVAGGTTGTRLTIFSVRHAFHAALNQRGLSSSEGAGAGLRGRQAL